MLRRRRSQRKALRLARMLSELDDRARLEQAARRSRAAARLSIARP